MGHVVNLNQFQDKGLMMDLTQSGNDLIILFVSIFSNCKPSSYNTFQLCIMYI